MLSIVCGVPRHPTRLLGATVKALRVARDITAITLADTIGVDRHYLSHIECGRRGGGIHAAAIAAAVGVHPDVITGRRPAIGELREAAGIDPGEFAASVGITRRRLTRLESGAETPPADLADRLARRLGVPVAVVTPPHLRQEEAA